MEEVIHFFYKTPKGLVKRLERIGTPEKTIQEMMEHYGEHICKIKERGKSPLGFLLLLTRENQSDKYYDVSAFLFHSGGENPGDAIEIALAPEKPSAYDENMAMSYGWRPEKS